MDRFERVNEKNLLQKDNFHSTLGGKIITDEEFKFALNVAYLLYLQDRWGNPPRRGRVHGKKLKSGTCMF